jgi:hypothetical protein
VRLNAVQKVMQTGERFGPEGQIEVIGAAEEKGRRGVRVVCHICKQEPDRYGDAIYTSLLYNLKKGFLPCGCAKKSRLSVEVLELRAKKYCSDMDYTYLGIVKEENFKYLIKARFRCNKDGHEWEGIIRNHLKGARCEVCDTQEFSDKFRAPEEEDIERFRAVQDYPEGTEFYRTPLGIGRPNARQWHVYCPLCANDDLAQAGLCTGIFPTTASSLLNGTRPCRCVPHRSGFDVNKGGYLYVLKICSGRHSFIGFGITGNLGHRLKTHGRNLRKNGYEITDTHIFSGSGGDVLRAETSLKKTIAITSTGVEGFIREASHLDNLAQILSFAENCLQSEEGFVTDSYQHLLL